MRTHAGRSSRFQAVSKPFSFQSADKQTDKETNKQTDVTERPTPRRRIYTRGMYEPTV